MEANSNSGGGVPPANGTADDANVTNLADCMEMPVDSKVGIRTRFPHTFSKNEILSRFGALCARASSR